MKIMIYVMTASVLFLGGCSYFQPQPQAKAQPAPQPNYALQTGGTASSGDCRSLAENRLSLYDKPDTYPINPQERNNALIALYSECMHEHQIVTASDTPGDASQFASLSPAAGGSMHSFGGAQQPYPTNSSVLLVQGTTANQYAQYANLSPSSGGMPPVTTYGGLNNGTTAPTVVVVQSAAPTPVPMPVVARPIPVTAVPQPMLATAYAPVAQPVAPHIHKKAVPQTAELSAPSKSAAESSGTVAVKAPAPILSPQSVQTRDPQQLEDTLLKN